MRNFSGAPHHVLLALLLCTACGGEKSTTTTTEPTTGPDLTPSSLTAAAGGSETARVGTSVTTPPAVTVRNAAGQGIAGIAVTFTVEAGGGTVSSGTATTDASGVARVGGWTLGSVAGENRVVSR